MDMKKEFGDNAEELEAWSTSKEVSIAEVDKLITEMRKAEADYQNKKAIASEAAELREKTRAKVLGILKTAGKKKYVVDGVGTAYIRQEYVVRTPKDIESKKSFLDYVKSLGEEFFLEKVTVHHKTLQSLYNSMREQAAEEGNANFKMPGIGEPTLRETINFRSQK